MRKIIVFGAFDTKGMEFAYLIDCMRELEPTLEIISIDVSARRHQPPFTPTVTNAEVAALAGGDLDTLSRGERLAAVTAMMQGVEIAVRDLCEKEDIGCVLSMGGGAGTVVGMKTLSTLPLGLGKIMITTIATSQTTASFVEGNDILVLNSVVDISGLNRVSRGVFRNAAGAAVGICRMKREGTPAQRKPVIAATMFGHTTPCVEAAKAWLEAHGYEVLVFHANGAGGRTMEKFIRRGIVDGVLDITTTEWADTICGGVCAGGEDRLTAAADCGIPQVVSVGALDMVNWGKKSAIPARYENRLYDGNDNSSLMRTNAGENRQFAEAIAKRLNASRQETVVMLPKGGVSNLDKPDGPFWDPQADAVLFEVLQEKLDNPNVRLITSDLHINDRIFGEAAAIELDRLMRAGNKGGIR